MGVLVAPAQPARYINIIYDGHTVYLGELRNLWHSGPRLVICALRHFLTALRRRPPAFTAADPTFPDLLSLRFRSWSGYSSSGISDPVPVPSPSSLSLAGILTTRVATRAMNQVLRNDGRFAALALMGTPTMKTSPLLSTTISMDFPTTTSPSSSRWGGPPKFTLTCPPREYDVISRK
ncbi:hypothetical protein BC826DRAFT_981461 [Russula brevipes]|nr:hypothetical protein BC826DRAFT_981461 [Russula brevipes]